MKTVINTLYSLIIFIGIISCNSTNDIKKISPIQEGTLETIAELDISPGNVAVSKEGRIFMSIHPLRSGHLQLVEIMENNQYIPFPNEAYQSTPDHKSETTFDTPLGIIFDNHNRLWIVDAGLNLGKPKIYAFDINTKEELYQFNIPSDVITKDSFVQDLAIDEINGWIYLADFGDPGIISLNLKDGKFRKFTDYTSMNSEDINMVIDGQIQFFMGVPARVAINPITLSEDRETLFYGPMNGQTWYKVPTTLFRENQPDELIKSHIKVEGPKPISDGAATSTNNKHYFTNLQNGSIDVLDQNGILKTLVKDSKIVWADNIRFGDKNWLYIAVNQLHKSPAFTGGNDESVLPYYILRVWVDK